MIFEIILFMTIIVGLYVYRNHAENAKVRENNTIMMLEFKQIYNEYQNYLNSEKIDHNKLHKFKMAIENMSPIIESFAGNYDWNCVGFFLPPKRFTKLE